MLGQSLRRFPNNKPALLCGCWLGGRYLIDSIMPSLSMLSSTLTTVTNSHRLTRNDVSKDPDAAVIFLQ